MSSTTGLYKFFILSLSKMRLHFHKVNQVIELSNVHELHEHELHESKDNDFIFPLRIDSIDLAKIRLSKKYIMEYNMEYNDIICENKKINLSKEYSNFRRSLSNNSKNLS